MSSIDKNRSRLLVSFFNREFVPVARLLSEEGVQLIEPGPDRECETYYIPRQKRSIDHADFELNLEDSDEVKRDLQKLWKGSESFILTDLSNKILALSSLFADVETAADVSPFIYVMF